MPKQTNMTDEELDHAKREILSLAQSLLLPIEMDVDPAAMRMMLSRGARPITSEGYFEIDDKWSKFAVVSAMKSATAFDYLWLVASMNLRAAKPLPPTVSKFVGHVMAGTLRKPKRKQSDAARISIRDILIMEMVDYLTSNFEINEGSGTKDIPDSVNAFQLVAETLAEVGMREVKSTTVKQVWQRRKKSGGWTKFLHFKAMREQLSNGGSIPV